MHERCIGLLLISFLTFGKGADFSMLKTQDKSGELGRFLPEEVEGWRASGRDETYDPETIFDYIDGAGEVYRAYNFRTLFVRRFEREGKADVVVDFFDMGCAADAFGVFTHDLDGERLDIGQAATYMGGLLSFWKGRYFVSVYAERETEETRDAVFRLGRKIASAIVEEGKKPDILDLIPSAFPQNGARYFHNHLILNYHFFVASENILHLDQDTEAVLVPSGQEEGRAHLLIVRYPSAEKTAQAQKSFIRSYMPDAIKPGFVRTEDETWTAIKPKKSYIILVFHAASEDQASRILKEVEQKIDEL
ncbi:MAG: hypothetical protein QHH14_09665 [Clostridiales bacterium]|nr:hypothetical protein [Clostridiales bacterium]